MNFIFASFHSYIEKYESSKDIFLEELQVWIG